MSRLMKMTVLFMWLMMLLITAAAASEEEPVVLLIEAKGKDCAFGMKSLKKRMNGPLR